MAIKLAMPFLGDNYYAIDHIFLEKKTGHRTACRGWVIIYGMDAIICNFVWLFVKLRRCIDIFTHTCKKCYLDTMKPCPPPPPQPRQAWFSLADLDFFGMVRGLVHWQLVCAPGAIQLFLLLFSALGMKSHPGRQLCFFVMCDITCIAHLVYCDVGAGLPGAAGRPQTRLPLMNPDYLWVWCGCWCSRSSWRLLV